jgi:CheY-like chemotaxis protein
MPRRGDSREIGNRRRPAGAASVDLASHDTIFDTQTQENPRIMSLLKNETAPILIVDDDSNSIVLLERLVRKAGIHNPIDVAGDGASAIDYLKTRLASRTLPRPILVLLDLKMPQVDGFEVLDWVRTQPELKTLLIAVVSSSAQERDMTRAYELGARSYLTKFPVASDLLSVYQLANSMMTVEELDRMTVARA